MANRFALAREAYRRRDLALARRAHAEELLNRPLREDGTRGQHLADAVLGATDGIVTTFAVVAGAAGASLSAGVVVLMGFANLVADGFSMAVGNYLGARSQREAWVEERRREFWEIENLPQGEAEEIRRIYREKGFEGDTLEEVVRIITTDRRRWLDEMMREELGIREESLAPVRSGAVTFGAFVLAGFLPLAAYVLAFLMPAVMPRAFTASMGVTAAALFGVGVARRWVTRRVWWRSGLEILAMGGLAAGCAYGVGNILRGLIG